MYVPQSSCETNDLGMQRASVLKIKIIQSPLAALQTPLKAYRPFRMNMAYLSSTTMFLGCLFAYHSVGEVQAQPASG